MIVIIVLVRSFYDSIICSLKADQGKENVIVADFMIAKRGTGRSSFITGSSTHNTRIERMWLEVLKGTTGTLAKL